MKTLKGTYVKHNKGLQQKKEVSLKASAENGTSESEQVTCKNVLAKVSLREQQLNLSKTGCGLTLLKKKHFDNASASHHTSPHPVFQDEAQVGCLCSPFYSWTEIVTRMGLMKSGGGFVSCYHRIFLLLESADGFCTCSCCFC